MKLFCAIIVFTLFHCNYAHSSSSHFKCYQCLHYDIPHSRDGHGRQRSDESCRINSIPHSNFLQECPDSQDGHGKGPLDICGLFHLTGENNDGQPFEMTLRDCLPIQHLHLGCHTMSPEQFKKLGGVDEEIKDLLPNPPSHVKYCMCNQDGCNVNTKTAGASRNFSGLSPKILFGFVLLTIAVSFGM